MNICTPCPYGKLKDFLENNFPFKNIEGGSGIQHTIISIFFSPRIDFFKNNLLCILLCQHMHHYLSAKEVFSAWQAEQNILNQVSAYLCGRIWGLLYELWMCYWAVGGYLETLQLTDRACLSLGEDRGGFRLLFMLGLPDSQACVPTAIKQQ